MNKNKIIEFVGMPGSGKTFFEKKIFKYSNKKIIKNNFNYLSKFDKIKYIVLFIFSYPNFFFKSINIILKNIFFKREFKKYFYYFYNETAFRSYIDTRKEKKLILLNSEGFVYRTSFYFNYIFNEKTENYLNCLPRIDLIIFIRSIKKIDLSRTNKRKIGFKYNKRDLKGFWLTAEHCDPSPSKNSDSFVVKEGYVSITPLHSEQTNLKFIKELSSWSFN